jgi:hypothetical protein
LEDEINRSRLRAEDSTPGDENRAPDAPAGGPQPPRLARLAERVALVGFVLYAIFAPHSIAGAEMGLALVAAGWLARSIVTGRTNIRRTPLDLPLWLFLGWTVLSALLSAEPGISLPKLQSVSVVFLFYLAQALLKRRAALLLALLMIASGVAGVLWSMADITLGRGVMIEELNAESPFREFQLGKGDAVWRVNAVRVASVREIDEAIRRSPAGERLRVSLIVQGEHAERPGFVVTDELKARPSPSGIRSEGRTHRFRASGWTRHYETFSETLQMLAQLALGLGLAHFQRRGRGWQVRLALSATALLAVGIALTAMRTVLVAFVCGAIVIAWRAVEGRARLLVAGIVVLVLALGTFSVWRTRVSGALKLEDYSSTLRREVARAGLRGIWQDPLFGHGMDAVKRHWTEWGFPGTDMIHLHSTPLQIAFDRGLPALLFWLWMIWTCWRMAARGERLFGADTDAGRPGLLLGATGAIAGFFVSSLVNYNFGDAEVALVFWWLIGSVVALSPRAE